MDRFRSQVYLIRACHVCVLSRISRCVIGLLFPALDVASLNHVRVLKFHVHRRWRSHQVIACDLEIARHPISVPHSFPFPSAMTETTSNPIDSPSFLPSSTCFSTSFPDFANLDRQIHMHSRVYPPIPLRFLTHVRVRFERRRSGARNERMWKEAKDARA